MIWKPILFKGDMVRAIQRDEKTQTRRVVKLPCDLPYCHPVPGGGWQFSQRETYIPVPGKPKLCPYGVPGDRLWVREKFGYWGNVTAKDSLVYGASFDPEKDDYENAEWHPSIHMPRWASRISLEVTEVRVERVQHISQADAKAEGCQAAPHRAPSMAGGCDDKKWSMGAGDCYRCSFRTLWTTIYGPRGFAWDVNPWVWVVTFKKSTNKGEKRAVRPTGGFTFTDAAAKKA